MGRLAAWMLGISAAVLFAAGCAAPQASVPPERELPALKARASGGDGAAAYALYQYYEYAAHDGASALSWLRRAADLGDIRARERLDWRAEYRKESSF